MEELKFVPMSKLGLGQYFEVSSDELYEETSFGRLDDRRFWLKILDMMSLMAEAITVHYMSVYRREDGTTILSAEEYAFYSEHDFKMLPFGIEILRERLNMSSTEDTFIYSWSNPMVHFDGCHIVLSVSVFVPSTWAAHKMFQETKGSREHTHTGTHTVYCSKYLTKWDFH